MPLSFNTLYIYATLTRSILTHDSTKTLAKSLLPVFLSAAELPMQSYWLYLNCVVPQFLPGNCNSKKCLLKDRC